MSVCVALLVVGCVSAEPTASTNEPGSRPQDGVIVPSTSAQDRSSTSSSLPDSIGATPFGSIDRFVAAWNRASIAQGRLEWAIPSTSRRDQQNGTSGVHLTLGDDESLVVDLTATADGVAKLEVAVPRHQGTGEPWVSDAFEIAVTASLWGDQNPRADDLVAELLDQSQSSDPASSTPLPISNDAYAQSFSTESLSVLVVTWSASDR